MNIRPPGPEQGPLVPQQRASDAVREARRAPAAGSRPVKRTKPGRASEIRSGGGVHRATERPLLSYARSAAELGAQAVRGLARSSTELGSRIANSPARYARLLLAGMRVVVASNGQQARDCSAAGEGGSDLHSIYSL